MKSKSDSRVLLISVRPEFASRILDGSKTVELRRQEPRVKKGDLVALYVSSPVKQLVATLEILNVTTDRPLNLWQVVSEHAGISRKEYDDYFRGATKAVGISLGKIRKKATPIALEKLRTLIEGFNPPQSFRYLCDTERSALSI